MKSYRLNGYRGLDTAIRALNWVSYQIVLATLTLKRGTETVAVGRSNPFGYYRFRNVPSSQTYDLSVRAKNTTFAARTVLVDDKINDFLIVGEKSTQQ